MFLPPYPAMRLDGEDLNAPLGVGEGEHDGSRYTLASYHTI